MSAIAIMHFATSCSSAKKYTSMTYFADSVKASQQIVTKKPDYKLQPGDRLNIVVTALNQQAAQEFNQMTVSSTTSTESTTPSGGYLVDDDGNIMFPQIGTVHVAGITTKKLADNLGDSLLNYLKEPLVTINILNFKVNILGEVNRPGPIVVPDGKMSVLEAISQSGDLTIYGKRENILLIREQNGKREFAKLDLTSNDIFDSPYFYLQQGDIIYVEMNKNKMVLSDASETRKFRITSILLAAVTAGAILFNSLK